MSGVRGNTIGGTCVLLLTLLVLTSAGCAGSLSKDFEARPYGAFAANRLAYESEGTTLPAEAGSQWTNEVSPDAEAVIIDLSAPVRVEELDAFGLSVDMAQASHYRDASWAPAERLSYAEARAAFLARSSLVDAIVKRHRARFSRVDQVDALNDLARQYDAFAEDLSTGASTPHAMPARAAWPLQGSDRVGSGIAEIDIELSRAQSSQTLRAELVDFEIAFHEALTWSRAASTYKRIARLARQSLQVAESRYQSGRGQYFSVLFAENRVDLLNAQRQSALEHASVGRAQLAALLELAPDALEDTALVSPEGPELPSREALRAEVLLRAPRLQEAEASAERARLMVLLVERQVLPELAAGTERSRTGDIPKRPSDLAFSTRAPFLVELSLVREAAEAAVESARRVVPAEAEELWAELSRATRDLKLAAGAERRRAKQASESAADAFDAGVISFFELDATLTRVLEIELSLHHHRRNAAIAAARLHAISGAP